MNQAELVLSEEQQVVHDAIIAYYENASKPSADQTLKHHMTFGGFAGTGKTSTIGKITETLKKNHEEIKIAFCAFTGKAAMVLASKLRAQGINDQCGTIHSLIYRPIVKKGHVQGWMKVQTLEYDLIFVDESSMVTEDIFYDLKRYKKPIVFVGDHGQLPPIGGDFNLMKDPDFKLETIHRQAQDNPIIKLSMIVRKTGKIFEGDLGQGVRKQIVDNLPGFIASTFDPQALYLCGYNQTRVYVNKMMRQIMNIRSQKPIKGDRVICLRNNRTVGIFNGMTGVIEEIKDFDKETYDVKIKMDGDRMYEGRISKFQFDQKSTPQNWNVFKQGDLFDFGYCLTVHKSQGSESESVVLIEERLPDMDDRIFGRWLYTAVTRAKSKLLILKKG